MIGRENITRLGQVHVLLFGLGGVGSFAAEALVRSGVGALSLVDYDLISDSNRNRQLPALSSSIGRIKTDAVGERLTDINPDLRLHLHQVRMTEENLQMLLECEGRFPDFIADAIDDLQAKTKLILTAKESGIPIISSMGAGRRLDPSMLAISDISETHTCPLARRLRKSLREAGVQEGVPVVWSKERPMRRLDLDEETAPGLNDSSPPGLDENSVLDLDDSSVLDLDDESAPGPASMVFVPGAAGLLMASYIVRQLTGHR